MNYDPADRSFYIDLKPLNEHHEAEMMFGFLPGAHGKGEVAELMMVWKRLGRDITMRLQVFDENWTAFAAMPEVMALLSEIGAAALNARRDNKPAPTLTPQAFGERLKALGFRDTTRQPRSISREQMGEVIAKALGQRSDISKVDVVGEGALAVALPTGKTIDITF